MKPDRITGIKLGIAVCTAIAAVFILLHQTPGFANTGKDAGGPDELLDKIRVQNLISRYYTDLEAKERTDLNEYFTEDSVLDVNGIVARGRDEIQAMYDNIPGPPPERRLGRKHMLLSNPVIEVHGDTATARFIWTGVVNDNVRVQPRLVEQGREYTDLVKHGGRWYIKKRVIRADSGVAPHWDYTVDPHSEG